VTFETHEIFGVAFPAFCPDVPTDILNPRHAWSNKEAYDQKAHFLAEAFIKNFEKFASLANEEILAGGPQVMGVN
jgi:phosphoenolpyruvate carboxykinase (ATP)